MKKQMTWPHSLTMNFNNLSCWANCHNQRLEKRVSHLRGTKVLHEDKLVAKSGVAVLFVARVKITRCSCLLPPLQVDPLKLQEDGCAVFEGFK